jgi:Permuted papain-like amidase enzyme, YaeF/YiiX, C92 family
MLCAALSARTDSGAAFTSISLGWGSSAVATGRCAAARPHNDTGFNLRSRRQFCSGFVREVFLEATDADLGEVVTFADLLAQHPGADLQLWKFSYFAPPNFLS